MVNQLVDAGGSRLGSDIKCANCSSAAWAVAAVQADFYEYVCIQPKVLSPHQLDKVDMELQL